MAAEDSPLPPLLPLSLPSATPVPPELEEEVPLDPEDSAADPDSCVLVALAVCEDFDAVEDVPKEGFAYNCYLSR